jgi:hypothetical protein
MARRVHSRYLRKVADLPVAGRRPEIAVQARRFFCDAIACRRRVFAERFDGQESVPGARTASMKSSLDEISPPVLALSYDEWVAITEFASSRGIDCQGRIGHLAGSSDLEQAKLRDVHMMSKWAHADNGDKNAGREC